MFYCDACRKSRKWPHSLSRSNGLCEICGKRATCNDVPSAELPLVVSTKEPRESKPRPKKPVYTSEESALAASLNERIKHDDVGAYAELTKLAAATVNAGRWVRAE